MSKEKHINCFLIYQKSDIHQDLDIKDNDHQGININLKD